MAVINSSYTRFLKQSIIIVQGVIVCLYVIQFTRYRHCSWRSFPSAANFYILAHLVELVKNFFQVFRSFLRCGLCSRFYPFITQLLYDITSTSFCQELFSCFLKFLFYRGCLVDSFDILARHSTFVKHFFTKTAYYFWLFSRKTLVLSAAYIFISC